ncbi:MAG: SDR family oxidoreductase [Nitrospirae bacterium]|nr:SDR family oxidoreductase [Nitrospirota bacterium]MBI3593534.1 SDR family oxidoreductase [Nitrospirota bacterium]
MVLKDKVAIVTGGGRGIGKYIARRMCESGAKVVICSRNERNLEKTRKDFEKQSGYESLIIRADISLKDQVQMVIDRTLEKWGKVDILVNNAGTGGMNPMTWLDDGQWFAMLETNLHGLYFMTKAALAQIQKNKTGRIINIASHLSKTAHPCYTAYCTAEHAILGFTRSLALEVAENGITVNAICAGLIDTDFAKKRTFEMADQLGLPQREYTQNVINSVPIKRLIDPLEVGSLAVYLASDQAQAVTGQAIDINGGLLVP